MQHGGDRRHDNRDHAESECSMEETGGMATEITRRVHVAWRNWKRCSGVLCDRRMPAKLKGEVYKTVPVRPMMLLGRRRKARTHGDK